MTPDNPQELPNGITLRPSNGKAVEWFTTPNPFLGNVSPWAMIKAGRGDKLCKWIDAQIEENAPIAAPSKQALDENRVMRILMESDDFYPKYHKYASDCLCKYCIVTKKISQNFSGTRGLSVEGLADLIREVRVSLKHSGLKYNMAEENLEIAQAIHDAQTNTFDTDCLQDPKDVK